MSAEIHPSAIIDPKAEIGSNVKIGPHVIVEGDVVIGDHCEIFSSASLLDGARLKNNVKIFQGSVISGIPQDLKFAGEKTTLEIGENSVIREFCTLNRGTEYHHKTVVGNDCFIMAYVHLAHDVLIGDKVIVANSVQIAGHVEIGNQVTIGGLVPIHQFVKIGDHAFIGGGYRVPKDVPPFIIAMGEPLVYGGLNKVGLRRRGFSREDIENIKKAYRYVYQSDMVKKDALSAIKDNMEINDNIKLIIDFLENSERGIIPSNWSPGSE